MRLRLALSGVLASLLLACSGGGGSDGGSGGGAGSDLVLTGSWKQVFVSAGVDNPSSAPRVAARAGEARLAWVSKTQRTRVLVVDAMGPRELTLPQGTKGNPRVAFAGAASVLVVPDPLQLGRFAAYREEAGTFSALASPVPGDELGAIEVTALGSDVFVAAQDVTLNAVVVERLDGAAWTRIGRFPLSGTLARLGFVGDGRSLVLMTLEGTATRTLRAYRSGAWEELGAPPPLASTSSLPFIAVDGQRVFFLEWDEAAQQSIAWVHDGAAWSEWARSQASECFHALAVHGGALYTFSGTSPNSGSAPRTRELARLDRGAVTRVALPFGPDSRGDVMLYEGSFLVSGGDAFYATYGEQGTSGFNAVRLHRVAR
ncbi:MAG: hypothetical protein AB1730_28230 [Myxococcota bacterium]